MRNGLNKHMEACIGIGCQYQDRLSYLGRAGIFENLHSKSGTAMERKDNIQHVFNMYAYTHTIHHTHTLQARTYAAHTTHSH